MATSSTGAALNSTGTASPLLAPVDLVDLDSLNPRQRLVVKALLGALEQGKLELPMLPEHAARALEVAGSAHSDLAAYEEVIKPNPAMTAALLKAANSPLYGAAREITSMRQATQMLGTATLSQLVMQVVVQMQKIGAPTDTAFVEAEHRHGLAVAHLAQKIARYVGIDPGDAFLCGLLHDMGRLVFPELARARSMNIPDDQAAILAYEMHAALGYRLCIAWSLPPLVLDAVSQHHHYAEAGPDEPCLIAQVIAMSEAGMIHYGVGGSESQLHGDRAHDVFRRLADELGMDGPAVDALEQAAASIVERTA